MNIKIGMDAKRIVRNASGLGSYGRNLVNALTGSSDCPELVLYAPDEGRTDLRSQVHASERLRFAYSGKHWRLAQDLWRGKGIVADRRQRARRAGRGDRWQQLPASPPRSAHAAP